MHVPPEPACLLIADISGYTTYLAGVELDHAQDILADLMDTVVGSLRPMFRLSKLEGDAAFAAAFTERVDGSILQDVIEGCYFAFQRRLRDIRLANTCPCDACIRIPTLDLKIVVHHGLVARQRMAGGEELVGRDVILLHRLLKNEVEPRLGIHAYALYTADCLEAMGIDDPSAAGLREHRETYEVIGEVTGWVRDLADAWATEQARASVVVEAADAGWIVDAELPAPPSVSWAILTAPEHRLRWQAGITGFEEQTRAGRRGIGTVNHCQHGADTIIEEILDWQPPHHQTVRVQMPVPGAPRLTFTDLLEATDEGTTRFAMRVQRPKSRKDRDLLGSIWPGIEESIRAGIAAVDPLIRAELERLAATEAVEPGIAVPVDSSASRSS
jgi:uncharacterized protein YndB with AHSA1/START domain